MSSERFLLLPRAKSAGFCLMLTRSVSAEYNSQIKIEIEALSAHVHICPDMRSLVKIPKYNVNNRIIEIELDGLIKNMQCNNI